ncbi:MAG: cytochrome d ubiquinol oxidase subunit II [Deltaproteobacteria bacterium]|nr:cytochrome d ubiquinol oxidase subunit II [Deltaproteobacteria bacterium]
MVAYAVLGGADFGGGVWDLLARGPRRVEQRAAIARAMGPVWEANHVWLIFVVVIFFTAFPTGWAAYATGLSAPLRVALLGIVLRGVAFVFRAYLPTHGSGEHRWGAVFGAASIVTPFMLGACVGAISSGQLRVIDGAVVLVGSPWAAPIALAMGAAGASLCAFLAAVFLTVETEGELQEDFRRKAQLAGAVVVLGAAATIPFTRTGAPHLWSGLMTRALPIVVAGTLAGAGAFVAVSTRRYRAARLLAIAQVALVIVGWAVAQHPFLIFPDVTVAAAAAPASTLRFVLWSLPLGLAIIGPSFWLLFRVFKGDAARLT